MKHALYILFLVLATTGMTREAEKPPPALVSASLVSENRSIVPGRPFWVAIRLDIDEGWHLNWINPGDAGLAPSVAWNLPDGFEAEELLWPFPRRFLSPELSIFGYEKEVILLSRITAPSAFIPGRTVTLRARVEWLACRDVCIPGGADVNLPIEVALGTPEVDPVVSSALGKARTTLPIVVEDWRFNARLSDNKITVEIHPPKGETLELSGVLLFPVYEGLIAGTAEQKLTRQEDMYVLDIERPTIRVDTPDRLLGVLVSAHGWGRIEEKALLIDVPLNQKP